jgi:plastocyanin
LIAAFAAVGSTYASQEPQTVHIDLTDSQVHVSQFVVAAGRPIKFEIANGGTIPHHLVVRPLSAGNASGGDEPVIGAHTTRTIDQALAPGIYRVSCDLFDHAERGMVSAIAVETTPHSAFPIPVNGLVSLLIFVAGCVYIIGDTLGFRLIQKGDR